MHNIHQSSRNKSSKIAEMNDSNLRRVSGLVGLVQKKREEFPLSFFPCPFKCICAERAVWQFGSIPISNSNLHPKSERHSNPIHSIQQRERERKKTCSVSVRIQDQRLYFFVRLSFSEEVDEKSYSAKSSNIVDSEVPSSQVFHVLQQQRICSICTIP